MSSDSVGEVIAGNNNKSWDMYWLSVFSSVFAMCCICGIVLYRRMCPTTLPAPEPLTPADEPLIYVCKLGLPCAYVLWWLVYEPPADKPLLSFLSLLQSRVPHRLMPKSNVSIKELDQTAAVIAGTFVLGFSIYSTAKSQYQARSLRMYSLFKPCETALMRKSARRVQVINSSKPKNCDRVQERRLRVYPRFAGGVWVPLIIQHQLTRK